MAEDINVINISGHLGQDAELAHTAGGTAVLSFSIASNYQKKTSNGWETFTNWVDCKMFGIRAESVARFLTKGTGVCITGKLHHATWEKDGQRRSKHEIIVDKFIFTGGGNSTKEAAEEPGLYEDDCPF